ncbi:hypothetical protein ACLEQD_21700, partial [Corallococcus sp. 4LFB]
MSISSLNRASFSQPLSSPAAAPAQGVAGTQAQQPRNDLRRMLMTDSFEQGPGRVGGASGDFAAQLAQAVSQLTQLVKALEVPSLGDLGEDAQDVAPRVGGAASASATPAAAPSAQGAA